MLQVTKGVLLHQALAILHKHYIEYFVTNYQYPIKTSWSSVKNRNYNLLYIGTVWIDQTYVAQKLQLTNSNGILCSILKMTVVTISDFVVTHLYSHSNNSCVINSNILFLINT